MRILSLLLVIFGFCLHPGVARASHNILVWGDSLSAGHGIKQDAAWPSLLQKRLITSRADYNVVNQSISGETTAGGLSRLPAALARHRPAIVLIALGANDGLRGLPLAAMQQNLQEMIELCRQAKATPLLVGMRLPPNYGPYAESFHGAFLDISRRKKVPLVPFLLDGIADRPAYFQADGLHPTAEAQSRILETVWPALQPLLKSPA